MSHTYYNINTRKFASHLTEIERGVIQSLLNEKRSVTYIANEIGVHRSTIYREIKRGTVEQIDTNLKKYKKYYACTGQIRYSENRKHSKKAYKLLKAQEFISDVIKLIKDKKYSVDASIGRLKLENTYINSVCTKTIYNYIDLGLISIKSIDLLLRVRRRKKRMIIRKNRRILGKSIELRPDICNEFGHWEIDTVIGSRKKGSVLLTIDERYTRQRYIMKLKDKTAESVVNALSNLISSFGSLKSKIFKSITADNGSEFSTLNKYFPTIDIYYCHPYSSFERGINEKQNSMIRRFLPKNKSLEDVSHETIQLISNWINNFPRKIFNYETSSERFNYELNNLV